MNCFVNRLRFTQLEDAVWVYLFLQSAAGRAQIERLMNGVGAPNLSFTQIRALAIAWPSAELSQAVCKMYLTEVAAVHQKGIDENNEIFFQEAAATKKALIQQLWSGDFLLHRTSMQESDEAKGAAPIV